MSLSRLSSLVALPLVTWAQVIKITSSSTNTPLPMVPAATNPAVVAITSASTTATVALTAHGLAVGDRFTIAGASLANYNGTFVVATVVNANSFTYTMAGTAASPAVGAALSTILYFAHGSPITGSTVTSLTSSGGVATVTTPSAHGLRVGDTVNMKGAFPADYNGVFLVATVGSATTFTYAVANGIASPATAIPALITLAIPATRPQRCSIIAAVGNSVPVLIGPNSSANHKSIAAGTEYIIDGEGAIFDLSNWYFQSSSASQSVSILFY